MDFSLTPEQLALQDSVRRFCEREYGFEQRRKLLATADGFSRANWATFAELGWLAAGLPEAAGGYGGGPVETMIILEQMARALVLEPFLSCAVLAAQAIAAQASPDQRDALLEPIIAGETLVALAHGEVGDTTVERRGADYVLNGSKTFVLGGPSADLLLVSAHIDQITSPLEGEVGPEGRVRGLPPQALLHEEHVTTMPRSSTTRDGGANPSPGAAFAAPTSPSRGEVNSYVSLFRVDPVAPGVTRQNYHAVDGRRVSDIIFDNVQLSPDALIGEEGTALPAIELAIDHAIIGLCAEAVGAMDAALWQTRDYLKTRKQFGVTLSSFQALQHRMADMLIETELARSMLYRGLAALAETDPAARRKGVSAAKVQIGEAGYFVGAQAIQLHGAIGVTEEYSVGHYFKRLTLARGLFGAIDTHLARFEALP